MDFSLINISLKDNNTLQSVLNDVGISNDSFFFYYTEQKKDGKTTYKLKNDLRKIMKLEDNNDSNKKVLVPMFDLEEDLNNKNTVYGLDSLRDFTPTALKFMKTAFLSNQDTFYNISYDTIKQTILNSFKKYFNIGVKFNEPLKDRYKGAPLFRIGKKGSTTGSTARRQLPTINITPVPLEDLKTNNPTKYNELIKEYYNVFKKPTDPKIDELDNLNTTAQGIMTRYNKYVEENKEFFVSLNKETNTGNIFSKSDIDQRQFVKAKKEDINLFKRQLTSIDNINTYVKMPVKNLTGENEGRVSNYITKTHGLIDALGTLLELRLKANNANILSTGNVNKDFTYIIDVKNYLESGGTEQDKEELLDELKKNINMLENVQDEFDAIKKVDFKDEFKEFKANIQDQINEIDGYLKDLNNMNFEQFKNTYSFQAAKNFPESKARPNRILKKVVEPLESKTPDEPPVVAAPVGDAQPIGSTAQNQPPNVPSSAPIVQPSVSAQTGGTVPAAANVAPVLPIPAAPRVAEGGLINELQQYKKYYEAIPIALKTSKITELEQDAVALLAAPNTINNNTLKPHRDFQKNPNKPKALQPGLIQNNVDQQQTKNLIDSAVDDAKNIKKQEQKDQEDVKMSDLRIDIRDGKELYMGVDADEKNLTNTNQYLKNQIEIKDKEIELLKAQMNTNQENIRKKMFNNIAPVFRNLVDIQFFSVVDPDQRDFVKSIF